MRQEWTCDVETIRRRPGGRETCGKSMDPEDSVELRDLSVLLEKLSTEERPDPHDAVKWKERCMVAEAALERTRQLQRKIEEELEADLESVEKMGEGMEGERWTDGSSARNLTDSGHVVQLVSSEGLRAPGEIFLGQGCIHVAQLLGTVDSRNLVGLRMLDEEQSQQADMEDSTVLLAPPPQCVARNTLGNFEGKEFDLCIAQSPPYSGNVHDWTDGCKETHTWEMMWKGRGEMEPLHRIKFKSTRDVTDLLHNHISNWKSNVSGENSKMSNKTEPPSLSVRQIFDSDEQQGKTEKDFDGLESLYKDLAKEREAYTHHRHKEKKLYSRQSVSRMLGVVYAKMLIRRQEKMLQKRAELRSKSLHRKKSSQSIGEPSATESDAKSPTIAEGIKLLPGKYLPSLDRESAMLTDKHVRCLAAQLPTRYRLSDWTLLYSSVKHGISLQTLYRKAAGKHPSILVMRDKTGYIFGCFVTEGWRSAAKYYGTGETFVFQLEPSQKAYSWSHKNNYFLFCTQESLAVGGGGHFAIWIDSDLSWGNSGVCETFDSPCLASSEDFHCVHVEVWGVR